MTLRARVYRRTQARVIKFSRDEIHLLLHGVCLPPVLPKHATVKMEWYVFGARPLCIYCDAATIGWSSGAGVMLVLVLVVVM